MAGILQTQDTNAADTVRSWGDSRWVTFGLPVALAVCIVRLWIMPLPSSLWVDEMVTYFVVTHGASDPTLRVAPQVADSIYYVLPALAIRVGGVSEISLRFFSLLAMGAALAAIWFLARKLINENAGWLAVFGCLASRNFNYQAAEARPYALGTCILAMSLLGLVRWLESGRIRDALLFTVGASMLWWVHLVFWPFYLLFGAYAVARLIEKNSARAWWQATGVFSIIGLACVPVVMRSLSLLRQAQAHVVAPVPGWGELARESRAGTVAGVCMIVYLASQYWKWPTHAPRPARSAIVLAGGWWLIDPLALFAFSHITGDSIFQPRYMFLAAPGMVMTAALLVTLMIPARLLRQAGAVLGAGVLIFGGHWGHLAMPHTRSDWRTASQTLQTWTGGEDVPVVCPSPFIEARQPVWRPDYPVSSFLYSHLLFYPKPGNVIRFPFEPSPEAEAYAASLARNTLPAARRFSIYGGERDVRFWRGWFSRRPELAGWHSSVLGLYGDVEIVGFTAPQ
jgi:Dolichyl-phosphate-mannose-protein mannosyltransferase